MAIITRGDILVLICLYIARTRVYLKRRRL